LYFHNIIDGLKLRKDKNKNKMNYTVKERFLKYVQIDTQADPNSDTFPSTEKQKNLSKVLVEELLEMGVKDAHMDEFGYVYGTIPSNSDKKDIPVVCFCSHVDTAPDCSGTHVKPLVHTNYQGQDIPLPLNSDAIIKPDDFPHLLNQIGEEIITTSGDTLLGADDKSGVAEIMDAAYQLINNPAIIHGDIKILFTPDEEIGKGVDHVDINKLGADFGYTMDGGVPGSVEDETFSADGATVNIEGRSAHPGYAKGKMENAMKIVAEIIDMLPKDKLSPETTSGKQGFIHPTAMNGILERAQVQFILRDFTNPLLEEKRKLLKTTVDKVMESYPNSKATIEIKEQYRNMKAVLDTKPFIMDYAEEAIRRTGLKVKKASIRGGTDGSRLSFMGLPCPNLFTGMQGIHSVREWISVKDMHLAVDTILNLVAVIEEKA